jgi:hypothetical protein
MFNNAGIAEIGLVQKIVVDGGVTAQTGMAAFISSFKS